MCKRIYANVYTNQIMFKKKNSSYNYIITICLISTPSTNIYI